MMPLRLVEVDPSPYPPPRHAKAALELSRAVTLMMLDPEAKYYPMDIARIHYTWELLNNPEDAVHSRVNLLRKCYVQLANRNKHGTNPLLSGAGWQRMLASNLHQVAALMAQLREAQAAQPHTIFTLVDGVLVPYPDQTASLEPPRALVKSKGPQRFALAVQPERPQTEEALSLTEAAEGTAEPAAPVTPESAVQINPITISTSIVEQIGAVGSDESCDVVPRDFLREPVTTGLNEPEGSFPNKIPPDPEVNIQLERNDFDTHQEAHNDLYRPLAERKPRKSWSWTPNNLFKVVLWMVIVIPFLIGFNGHPRNEVFLDEIVELGAPFQEASYFIAKGVRYGEGDRLRFEDEDGVITKIDRTRIMVDDRVYPAPDLIILGGLMEVDGNLVVYPKNPARRKAGNFWVNNVDDLDKVRANYVSWIGGFHNDGFVYCDLKVAGEFWQDVTKETLRVKGEKLLVIPEDTQLEDFLDQCAESGAFIEEDKGIKVIEW